ncbi:MAG: hypothetical protein WAL50_04400, partial [Kineosporiaceae bacterium]
MAQPVVTVPDERWLGLWPDGAAPVEVTLWDLRGPSPVEPVFVVLPYMGTATVVARLAEVAGSVQVVQTLSAGYETVLPFVPAGVSLANAAGVH